MALLLGTKPTTYASILTGLPSRIYDNWLADGVIGPETPISQVIDGETYTEPTSQKDNRVLKAKLKAFGEAKAVIDEITLGAEVNNISGIINTSLSTAVTVPEDGGASLKTTLSAALVLNNTLQKGTIS
jgi:hypothetical protein